MGKDYWLNELFVENDVVMLPLSQPDLCLG